jgi:hypothetical protein
MFNKNGSTNDGIPIYKIPNNVYAIFSNETVKSFAKISRAYIKDKSEIKKRKNNGNACGYE